MELVRSSATPNRGFSENTLPQVCTGLIFSKIHQRLTRTDGFLYFDAYTGAANRSVPRRKGLGRHGGLVLWRFTMQSGSRLFCSPLQNGLTHCAAISRNQRVFRARRETLANLAARGPQSHATGGFLDEGHGEDSTGKALYCIDHEDPAQVSLSESSPVLSITHEAPALFLIRRLLDHSHFVPRRSSRFLVHLSIAMPIHPPFILALPSKKQIPQINRQSTVYPAPHTLRRASFMQISSGFSRWPLQHCCRTNCTHPLLYLYLDHGALMP